MGCGQSNDIVEAQSPIRVRFVGAVPETSKTLEISRLFPTLEAAIISDVLTTSENEDVAMQKLQALSPQQKLSEVSTINSSNGAAPATSPAAASTAPVVVLVSSTHWECPKCTFLNSLSLEACELCSAEKPPLLLAQEETLGEKQKSSFLNFPEPQLEGPQTCSLCLIDDLTSEEMFTLPGCGHSFCQDCSLDRWYTMGRGDENGFEASFLHCPQCKKRVSSIHLRELIIPARLNFQLINERHRGDHKAAVAEQALDRNYLNQYEKLEFDGYLMSGGVSQDIAICPGQNCDYKFILPRGARNVPTCLLCPKCGLKSCAACKKSPFHYGTTCQEAGAIQANFVAVVQKLTPAGLKERDEQLAAFEAKRKDEQYKQANCVCCPHCGRVAEHGGGCPSMVCGYTVTGNRNVGCGKSFRWDVAKRETPYVPTIPDTLPEAVQDINRYLECRKDRRGVLGSHARCAGCRKQIATGTYFECICCRPDQPTLHCVKCIKKMLKYHPKDHFSKVHF